MSKHELADDILKELFNISVGKAANMLSEIINKRIVLSVPKVEIFDIKSEKNKLNDYLPKLLNGTLMVSSISFGKSLTGKANLIFPVKNMKTFISLCLNEEEDTHQMDFTDVDFDIIKEVGNIILNCIIGEIGNFLTIDLTYTLPEVKVFNKIDLNRDIKNSEDTHHILLLYITFVINDTEIEGAIIIDLTFNSLNELMKKIDEIEDKLYE